MAKKSSAQDSMSKAETPVRRRTFRAVCEFVAYIPSPIDSEIAKGTNHASKITTPGRLAVKEGRYLNGWTMAVYRSQAKLQRFVTEE